MCKLFFFKTLDVNSSEKRCILNFMTVTRRLINMFDPGRRAPAATFIMILIWSLNYFVLINLNCEFFKHDGLFMFLVHISPSAAADEV